MPPQLPTFWFNHFDQFRGFTTTCLQTSLNCHRAHSTHTCVWLSAPGLLDANTYTLELRTVVLVVFVFLCCLFSKFALLVPLFPAASHFSTGFLVICTFFLFQPFLVVLCYFCWKLVMLDVITPWLMDGTKKRGSGKSGARHSNQSMDENIIVFSN